MPETATFDHYEVLTRDDGSLYELGRGAMGITYKAFDTSLRITVALKVINSTYLNSEVARQRFIREARSAAKLRHRHVASVFHLGTEGDTWFYAMEFIDGETVEALIKRQGPLSPLIALTITGQVARALNAAAQHGLVHRDIKPANLMLVREDDELMVKVIDFGLAKTNVLGEGEESAATLSIGGFVGTPHFASPEQLEEKEIDVRSDIYSLGITLWYMLAGQAPFAGSMAQVMSQHLSKPPPFERMENVPRPVANLLKKMLEKDPANRFQAAADLRKAVEETIELIGDAPAAAPSATNAPVDEENFATLLETAADRPGETRFEVGVVLASRYRINEVLGETNAGRAFRALDDQRKHEVRILVLHPDFLADSLACTALEREVERLAPVQHPNLLGVYDFETIEQASFLALEWTNGFSLLELLRSRRELDAPETIALLTQAAAGADHALSIGLTGLEFGLHQVLVHFAKPIDKDTLLRARIPEWPEFTVKLYPLGLTRDLATSQTWAGAQTMVGDGAASQPGAPTAAGRAIHALAALTYELLGGTLSPVALSAGSSVRYTPLSTLSEEGNAVLKRALDSPQTFSSAKDFSTAIAKLDGQQVRRHDSEAAVAPAAPLVPPPLPAAKKKLPLAFVGGFVTIAALGTAVYFIAHKPGGQQTAGGGDTVVATHGDGGENSQESENERNRQKQIDEEKQKQKERDDAEAMKRQQEQKAEEERQRQLDMKLAAERERQQKLKLAADKAEEFERDGNWEQSLAAWLKLTKDFPESGLGKNHLETLLNRLCERPSPITADEFKAMREQITEAAQLDILSAMMLLADNIREREPAAAFSWYQKAVDKGHATALTQLGLMYSNGAGIDKPDLAKAVECFRKAADLGDAAGKFALGECYLFGNKGVAKDEKRGLELMREAAAAGNLRAMTRLGVYMRGAGAAKEKEFARTHPGNTTYGQAGKEEFAEAFRLFTQASDRGNLEALGNLGILYLNGEGVPSANAKKGADLIKKGADGGNGTCMYFYARCLESGTGVGRNQLQSQAWYRKAAEAGNKEAAIWCETNKVPFERK
jgi:serine/threonine protein kinase/TPR repeat protein